MRRLARGLVALVAAVMLAAACGGDDDAAPTTTAPDPGADEGVVPTDLTGAEVCALVDPGVLSEALGGVELAEPQGSEIGTPQCSWSFPTEDGVTNVVLAVQRTQDDLFGLVGAEAYDYAVGLNETLLGGLATEIEGLGTAATFVDGDAVSGVVVQAGPRIVTLFGVDLDEDTARTIAAAAVAGL